MLFRKAALLSFGGSTSLVCKRDIGPVQKPHIVLVFILGDVPARFALDSDFVRVQTIKGRMNDACSDAVIQHNDDNTKMRIHNTFYNTCMFYNNCADSCACKLFTRSSSCLLCCVLPSVYAFYV